MTARCGIGASPVNTISEVTVDYADPAFPLSNAFDLHPKRVCKSTAGIYLLTIEAKLAIGCNSFFIFNTNAEGAFIEFEGYGIIEWLNGNEWFTGNEWYEVYSTSINGEMIWANNTASLVITFPTLENTEHLKITLGNSTAGRIYFGILWAGTLIYSHNPSYGLTEGQVDYSIKKELSNGSYYYKKRDIVRTFSGSFYETDIDIADNFLLGISRDYGQQSMPWLVTNLDNTRWAMFGHLDDLMQATYASYGYETLKFKLIEVL